MVYTDMGKLKLGKYATMVGGIIVMGFAMILPCVAGCARASENQEETSQTASKPDADYVNVARHGEEISILCDFGISSARPRFFVYDNKQKKLLSKSKCAHGGGGGSTANRPVFSNKPGSGCSSLGEYRLRCNDRMHNYDVPCIRIDGLSPTNSNAASRGIVIHECPVLGESYTNGIPIPAITTISEGCFAISSKTLDVLQELVGQGKRIYLYAVCEDK